MARTYYGFDGYGDTVITNPGNGRYSRLMVVNVSASSPEAAEREFEDIVEAFSRSADSSMCNLSDEEERRDGFRPMFCPYYDDDDSDDETSVFWTPPVSVNEVSGGLIVRTSKAGK